MTMHFMLAAGLAAASLAAASAVPAQIEQTRANDPALKKSAESRQYRSEPKGNAKQRNTRCRIIRQRGQDKRVCGTPTNSPTKPAARGG